MDDAKAALPVSRLEATASAVTVGLHSGWRRNCQPVTERFPLTGLGAGADEVPRPPRPPGPPLPPGPPGPPWPPWRPWPPCPVAQLGAVMVLSSRVTAPLR